MDGQTDRDKPMDSGISGLDRQTERQMDGQTDRDKRSDGQTERDKWTERQTEISC